jgi:hypothetical protein
MSRNDLHATSVRRLSLLAGASLTTTLLSAQVEHRSRTVKLAVGLVGTAAAMVLARSLGADLRAAFTGSHPELAGQLVRTVLSRPAGG